MESGLQTKELEIGDITFQTTQFPAMRAFEVLASLIKVGGPVLALIANADQTADLSTIAPQLSSALSGLKASEAKTLLQDMLANTRAIVRDGGKLKIIELTSEEKINSVFSGKLMVMFQVFGHALRTNYGDFSVGSDQTAPTPALENG